MTDNKSQIIEYMKQYYPNNYASLCRGEELSNEEVWKRANARIKEPKSHHGGSDMSGMLSILSSIKLERVALGELCIHESELYPGQLAKVQEMARMKASEIKRRDIVVPLYEYNP